MGPFLDGGDGGGGESGLKISLHAGWSRLQVTVLEFSLFHLFILSIDPFLDGDGDGDSDSDGDGRGGESKLKISLLAGWGRLQVTVR